MKRFYCLLAILCLGLTLSAQRIDSIKFFLDEGLVNMDLTTDLKGLQSQKGKPVFIPGSVKITMPGGEVYEEDIKVSPRGVNRRQNCKIPPMKLDFRVNASSPLSSLGKLKLVHGCGTSSADEELLLKEFVCYKLYNMLDDRSFRVRLLKVNYSDINGKFKNYTQYSFLIEDDADMAKRNDCRKKTLFPAYNQEATDRNMMTLVTLFQYMIGNTDWAVPNNHNIALIWPKKNDAALPYAIAYDFDFSGLVDAGYAVPSEIIGTEKVTERVYRGFPRTMEELQLCLDKFRAKKEEMLKYVNEFSLISARTRKSMVEYLEEFFSTIESRKQVQDIFIDNARTK